ncbi:ly6/PLAUR domain-containing protein 6B [Diachasma alloeum]|uniref:ly6/PLAUR domain-containing protein 6B n=1 Tax=Diachasma alloeum TaxID=454923 RepID=UPI00073850AF|nr:ly6/PLAUR domain-containing protein 6B [Diachasma alloeum]XP_015115841.1 ly6/PLAUR domain-containing protein 6B [Diachasma alloeum]XP_015115842.1 ly6/PLAUR domain-containing protein 6B [Diachasma alloeum]XP_028982083.1 ly6/PLAUR domain-containing protein 6B [Diachasma alloeum]
MITWVMVGLLLAAETTCGRNLVSENEVGRDELKTKQNGLKRPADEEDTYRLTCYTCVNVSDNQMCNKWAIDTPCPTGGRVFCRSLHILDSRGNSVLVSKSCASSAECGPASVGCVPVDTQRICISCCDMSYCNVESPTNSTNAIYTRKRRGKSKGKRKKPGRNDSGATIRHISNLSLTTLVASLLYAYHC